jgi:hypothetical protein
VGFILQRHPTQAQQAHRQLLGFQEPSVIIVRAEDSKWALTPGTQYYIRAYNESTGAETMRAVTDVYAPAPNDECSGALPPEVTPVGGTPKPVNISTIHTSSSTVPCYTEPHDAWLSFTAPGTNVIVVADDGNPSAALYSGSCGALVCVAEDNANLRVEFSGLTPGATYFLKIGASTLGRKNITVWGFAPITNDDCATAIPITVQNDPDVFTEGHQFNASQRAWYTFTATATRHVVEGYLTATENGISPVAAVHSGTCGNLTQLAAGGISVPLLVSGLTIGQQYHHRPAVSPGNGSRMGQRLSGGGARWCGERCM